MPTATDKPADKTTLVVSLRKQPVKAGERLVERAAAKGGKIVVVAGTGDAGAKVRVGQKVRVVGERLPDVQADAPVEAKVVDPDAMDGEMIATALRNELTPLFPLGALRVRYEPPALWIDYLPMRLKISVRSQHVMELITQGPKEVTADQSSGPQGLFRPKSGTARQVIDYIARFFKRLRDKPVVEMPTSAGGKRRHAKVTKRRSTKRAVQRHATRAKRPSQLAALVASINRLTR